MATVEHISQNHTTSCVCSKHAMLISLTLGQGCLALGLDMLNGVDLTCEDMIKNILGWIEAGLVACASCLILMLGLISSKDFEPAFVQIHPKSPCFPHPINQRYGWERLATPGPEPGGGREID